MSSWMWRGRVGKESVSEREAIEAESQEGGGGMGSSILEQKSRRTRRCYPREFAACQLQGMIVIDVLNL